MPSADFYDRLLHSSVALVRLDANQLPESCASGCLIDYGGKRILLAVSHTTGDQKNWAIQLRYVPSSGTETHQIGAMNFLARVRLDGARPENIDFSYAEVPMTTIAYRQEIKAPENEITSETQITVHTPTFTASPKVDEEYGFCGTVLGELETHFGQTYLGGEIRVYRHLSFLRTENDYHVFALPCPHPGHQHFQGCSGAPILGSSGSLVALVCGGCEKTNEIYGIALAAYKLPLDVLVGVAEQGGQ